MTETDGLTGVAALARRYPVWLCDVWGVVHDGIKSFDRAVSALREFRQGGGHVVLLTNAPRPAAPVTEQLTGLGVTPDAYDAVVTSGDATRDMIVEAGCRSVLHIGPERDLAFFDGLPVRRVAAQDADCVVCTGLFDDEGENPEEYSDRFAALIAQRLPFFCANPDRVVRRGGALYHCAGALADVYRRLGGRVEIAGKPHAPIYRRALQQVAEMRGAPVDAHDVLVVGDGIDTDMRGAAGQGFDALFILDGIHASELGIDVDRVDAKQTARAEQALSERVEGLSCVAILPQLRW